MVQEVQTGVGITNETTLETIEAIGTSSFKIREGRQTTGARYASGCDASTLIGWNYSSGGSRTSPQIQGTLTISDPYGKQDFIVKDGGVRLPTAGTYQITLTWTGGGPTHYTTIILKGGGNVLYTKQFTYNQTETVTITQDFGKFDTIELRAEFEYVGSASGAGLSTNPSIKIQQL